MKKMNFALSVPSHVYVGLHLLERMCRLRLVGAQWCSVNEKYDFRLISAQSCILLFSSTRTDVLPSPHRCLAMMYPIPL
jgi:hypothetical protein